MKSGTGRKDVTDVYLHPQGGAYAPFNYQSDVSIILFCRQ